MNHNHGDIHIETPKGSKIVEFKATPGLSRRDFIMAGALISAGALGIGNAQAQTPPVGAPVAKTSSSKISVGMLPVNENDRKYMKMALAEMRRAGVVEKTGGPFGAVVVHNGVILSASGNSVMKDKDPTAHAEVNAIRAACRKAGTVDLSGAVLYSSCECCPLCYATAYWARISKVFYAAAWTDYQDIFDDLAMNLDMKKPYSERLLAPQQIMQAEAQQIWKEFRELPDGARY